jgi:hypothetical protein
MPRYFVRIQQMVVCKSCGMKNRNVPLFALMTKLRACIFICVIYLSGCSFISQGTYYAPIQPEGVKTQLSNNTFPQPLTGPYRVLEITKPEIIFDIHTRPMFEFPITIGPLYFPLIPLFPLNKLINLYPSNIPFIFMLEIRVKSYGSERSEVKWAINNIKLLLPDGSETLPKTYSEKEKKWNYSPKITHYYYNTLMYDINIPDVESFRLKLDGLIIRDKPISLPMIEFKKAKGFYIEGPAF